MDKKLLNEAVKKIGLLAQAKTLWIIHPLLEQMAADFASYVGLESQAANGKPLLCEALKDAMGKYKAHEDNDKEAIGAFTRSLIDSSAEVFAQKIVVQTERGDIAWSPFVCGLSEFMKSYPNAVVKSTRQDVKIPAAIATSFMMTKIIPHSLLDMDSLSELLNEIKVTN